MSGTIKVTDSSFEADVLKSDIPVVVDFWAEWCGPCRMIGPALEEIAGEMEGKVKVAKVNVDENQAIAAQFGIRSIPALMVFKNGQKVSDMVGAAPKARLSQWIEGAI
jgi:thioredoxin 1